MVDTNSLFFFQAEDGIRDDLVTGFRRVLFRSTAVVVGAGEMGVLATKHLLRAGCDVVMIGREQERSEERRVGKEWRSRWSP